MERHRPNTTDARKDRKFCFIKNNPYKKIISRVCGQEEDEVLLPGYSREHKLSFFDSTNMQSESASYVMKKNCVFVKKKNRRSNQKSNKDWVGTFKALAIA